MVHLSCFDLKGETALHAGKPSLIAVMSHMYGQTWLFCDELGAQASPGSKMKQRWGDFHSSVS